MHDQQSQSELSLRETSMRKFSPIVADWELAQKCAKLISMIQEQRFDPYVRGWEKSEMFSISGTGGFFSGRPESWSEEVKALIELDMLQLCKSTTEDHDVVRILPRQREKVEQFMDLYMTCLNKTGTNYDRKSDVQRSPTKSIPSNPRST